MRGTCDTNILVRAAISPYGPAAELVRTIVKAHSLIVSPPILAVLYDVLRRPQVRRFHALRDAKIRRVVSRFSVLATLVPLPMELPAVVRHDPNDNSIVMTAIVGRCDALCTLDRHLHEPAVVSLCASQGIRVLRDAELLAELRASETR